MILDHYCRIADDTVALTVPLRSILEQTAPVLPLAHRTCVSSSENCGSLLSSTKLSQVMSVIHLHSLGGQAFISRAAPPVGRRQDCWDCMYKS